MTTNAKSPQAEAASATPRKRPLWASLWFYLVILFILVPVCSILWLAVVGHPERQVHISAETTVITGPLTSKKIIDYPAALRQRHRTEVPADENAARLIAEALGPLIFATPEMARMAYDELEMSPLPVEGDYRVSLDQLLRQQATDAGETYNAERFNELAELLTPCQQVPWSAEEQPDFAAWIAANELPLQKVHAASRLPSFRHPVLIPPGGSLIEWLLPITQELRDFGRLLSLRAMQRVDSGDLQEAWTDILAVHRLARLQAQGDTLIEYLVGIANSAMATSAMQAILSSPEMTPELLATIRADWQSLPAWPDISQIIDTAERYSTLDVIQRTARFGPVYLSSVMGAVGFSGTPDGYRGFPANGVMARAINAMVDWDYVLVEANRWFDQIAHALGEPDPALRATLIEQFDRDLEALASDTRNSWFPSTYNIGGKILSSMLPAVSGMNRAMTSRDARDAIVQTVFAVEEYRAATGNLPATLADLVPDYVPTVPLDPHSPADELNYVTQGDDGYVLYSVGHDGFDDGGLTEDSDIAFRVRMPIPVWLDVEPATTPAVTPDPSASSQVQ